MKKENIAAAEIFVILVSFYCFIRPEILMWSGYDFSDEGIIIAKTLCLLFSLHYFVKVVWLFNSGKTEGDQ